MARDGAPIDQPVEAVISAICRDLGLPGAKLEPKLGPKLVPDLEPGVMPARRPAAPDG